MDSWVPHSLRYPPLQPICQSAAALISLPATLAVIKVSLCKEKPKNPKKNQWKTLSHPGGGGGGGGGTVPAKKQSSRLISPPP